jgi:hypothetical protein
MMSRFLSIFFLSAAFTFAAEPDSFTTSTLVGVLMDARCPAIQGETDMRAASIQTVAARPKKAPRKAAAEGTRSRSADNGDKYESCKATAETTAFALHTDGRLHLLDENGNEVVRQHIRNDSFRASLADEAGTPRWVTVMVEARAAGDRLTITSMRR